MAYIPLYIGIFITSPLLQIAFLDRMGEKFKSAQFFKILLFLLVPLQMAGLAKNPLAGLAALGLAGAIPSNTGGLNQTGINNCMKSLF